MGTFMLTAGSILLLVSIGLFWWNIRLLRRLRYSRSQVEVSLAAMVEELEIVTKQCIERISLEADRTDRSKVVPVPAGVGKLSEVQRGLPVHSAERTSPTPKQKKSAILHLADTGLSSAEIARKLGIGRGEVELALGLASYQKEAGVVDAQEKL